MDPPKSLPTHFAPAERASDTELSHQIALWNEQSQMRILADAMPNGVLILNQYRQAVFANKTFLKVAQLADPAPLYGKRPGEIVNCQHAFYDEGGCGTSQFCERCGAVRAILSSLRGMEDIQECRIQPLNNQPTLNLRVWSTPIQLAGQMFSIFAVEDIGLELKNKELTEKLQEMVIRDPLTMLHNRRHLFNEAEREFSRSSRYQHPLSLLMLDIDYFKRVNDTYGHDAGDKVLVGVADVLRRATRKMDLVVRYGGEEFVILMPEAGPEEAQEASERLRSILENEVFAYVEDHITVTLSIGVSGTYDHADISVEELIKQADAALYAAKAAGRNCVRIWVDDGDGSALS